MGEEDYVDIIDIKPELLREGSKLLTNKQKPFSVLLIYLEM